MTMDEIGSLEVRWIQGFTNKSIDFDDSKTVCYTCGGTWRGWKWSRPSWRKSFHSDEKLWKLAQRSVIVSTFGALCLLSCSSKLSVSRNRPVSVIVKRAAPRTVLLNMDILTNFCDKRTYTPSHQNRRVTDFADDLLESLTSMCGRDANMEVGDFVGTGNMFEGV